MSVTELVATNGVGTDLVPVVHERPLARPAIPTFSFQDLQNMADVMCQTGMWGKKNYVQCLGLMLTAQAKGIHPAEANERFHVMVDGKVTPQAWHIQAVFLQRGGRIEFHQSDDEACDATYTSRIGTSLRVIWDTEKAIKAGLASKDIWKKHPAQMKRARCIAEGVRAVDPESLGGMYLAEELEGVSPAVTPPMQVTSSVSPSEGPRNITPSDSNPEREAKRHLIATKQAFLDEADRLEVGLQLRTTGKPDGKKMLAFLIEIMRHNDIPIIDGIENSSVDWAGGIRFMSEFCAYRDSPAGAVETGDALDEDTPLTSPFTDEEEAAAEAKAAAKGVI